MTVIRLLHLLSTRDICHLTVSCPTNRWKVSLTPSEVGPLLENSGITLVGSVESDPDELTITAYCSGCRRQRTCQMLGREGMSTKEISRLREQRTSASTLQRKVEVSSDHG